MAGVERYIIALWLFSLIVVFSCGLEQGNFGYGTSRQDLKGYRDRLPVFSADESVHWVYHLPGAGGQPFGVRLERQGLGWVQMETLTLVADKEFDTIYHHYASLKPGLYRLTIYEDQEPLDRSQFRVVPPDSY